MRVYNRSGQPVTTSPFLEKNGIAFELRGGDICHPWGSGDWFKPPYFRSVWRAFCRWPVLPWITWRRGNRGGYIGFKAYGADSEAYKNWMDPADVYEGSMALQMSCRPFATLPASNA